MKRSSFSNPLAIILTLCLALAIPGIALAESGHSSHGHDGHHDVHHEDKGHNDEGDGHGGSHGEIGHEGHLTMNMHGDTIEIKGETISGVRATVHISDISAEMEKRGRPETHRLAVSFQETSSAAQSPPVAPPSTLLKAMTKQAI